jgi:diguanylate cyclase (GGDEF)-like protein
MEMLLRLNINIFSLLFVSVLVIGSINKSERHFLDYRLFMFMLGMIVFEIVTDTAMWLLDGVPGRFGRNLLLVSSLAYYMGHPIAPMCYCLYAMNQITGNPRKVRALVPLFAIPAIISAVISLATLRTGWYFYLDSANAYRHGPLFPIFSLASYLYLFVAFVCIMIFAQRKAIDRRTFIGLAFFPLPPAIAGALQIRYFGLVLIWPAMVLSLLVIYISIQQRKITRDYLTGASSRRSLDEYLTSKVGDFVSRTNPRRFSGFLADVDDFKTINDSFGHAVGDEALIETVRLIRESLRSEDFLSRYAGDEFVVILPMSSAEQLAQVVERVRSHFAAYVPAGGRYRLSLSIGSAVFDPDIDENAEKFVERLDALMYREKEAKKGVRGEG